MKQDVKQKSQCTFQWRRSSPSSSPLSVKARISAITLLSLALTIRAPTEDQVARAKALAEDLLVVLRIEYGKARGDSGGGYNGGYQQQQAYGQDQGQYAGYYQVYPLFPFLPLHPATHFIAPDSLLLRHTDEALAPAPNPADMQQQPEASATPAAAAPGATPAQGSDAWAQYAAYWAAYGYDVNDPQCTSSPITSGIS